MTQQGFGPRVCSVGIALVVVAAMLQGSTDAALCYRSFTKAAYPNCQLLSPSYALHWSVSGTTISYGVEVDGPVGWLGLGISDGGGMHGADIVVVQTPDGGHTWTAQDYFAEGEMRPKLDGVLGGTQDVTMLTGVVRTATHTAAAFSRPLESCDPWDWPIMDDVPQTVIWAFGTGEFEYHGPSNRGSAVLLLQPLPGAPPAPLDPPDLMPLVIQLPAPFTIPADCVTTYMCANLALPSDAKYHTIRYDSLVNSSLVHHQVLFSCSSPPSHPVGELFECQHHGEANCPAAYMVAGPGSHTVTMPPEAGLPLGQGSVQYATLQIHYTNPKGLTGQVDQSGFVAYVTKELRPHDMGTLSLGSTNITLPPGQAEVSLVPNACPGACTRRLQEPLNVFTSFLHMHYLGKSISTRLVRNGHELPAIGYKNHFSYGSQGSTGAPLASRTIQPGDALITTCSYDTRNATKVTKFGPASFDEMCFNFLMYWPRLPDLDTCITTASADDQVPVAKCAAASDLQTGNMTHTELLATGQMVQSPLGGPAYQPYVSQCGLSATRTRVASPVAPAGEPSAGGSQVVMAAARRPTLTASGRRLLGRQGELPTALPWLTSWWWRRSPVSSLV